MSGSATKKDCESLDHSASKPRTAVGASFFEIIELPNVEVFGAAREAWPR